MNTRKYWLPIVFICSTIFLSSQLVRLPGGLSPQASQALQLAAHLALYSCLGVFVARLFRQGLGGRPVLVVVLTTNVCAMFGMYDEFHQSFVGGRGVEALDVVADAAGGIAGGLVYVAWARTKARVGSDFREIRSADLARQAAIVLSLFIFVLVPATAYNTIIYDGVSSFVSRTAVLSLMPDKLVSTPDRPPGKGVMSLASSAIVGTDDSALSSSDEASAMLHDFAEAMENLRNSGARPVLQVQAAR